MTTTTAHLGHQEARSHLAVTWIAAAIVLVILLASTFVLGRATADDGPTASPVKPTQSIDSRASTPNTGPRTCGIPGPPC